MNSEKILYNVQHVLLPLIEKKTGLTIPYPEAILLIGSSVYPNTRRENSDVDLILLIDDSCGEDTANTKINLKKMGLTELEGSYDVLIYTVSSFHSEMLFGSLTRPFAILNAFKILHSACGEVEKILALAEERMQESVNLTKQHLQAISIEDELEHVADLYNTSLSILSAGKNQLHTLLHHLRLFEYTKELIVQFQRLLFAADIQQKKISPSLDTSVRNLLVFNNSDGTRLLNPAKYYVDLRVQELVDSLNKILQDERDIGSFPQLLFHAIEEAFSKHLHYGLIPKKIYYKQTAVKL